MTTMCFLRASLQQTLQLHNEHGHVVMTSSLNRRFGQPFRHLSQRHAIASHASHNCTQLRIRPHVLIEQPHQQGCDQASNTQRESQSWQKKNESQRSETHTQFKTNPGILAPKTLYCFTVVWRRVKIRTQNPSLAMTR